MKLEFTYEPIVKWPSALTPTRRDSPFRASYGKTLDLLDKELSHLGARTIVLQVAMTRDQIRLDGRPRAGEKPEHPGIILSFRTSKGEDLSFPCDKYKHWEDNLRAIALSLEALRTVDRYGVTRSREQYKGWVALPETSDSTNEAAQLLASYSGHQAREILNSAEIRDYAYKIACRSTHPDIAGGSNDKFLKVQDAMTLLKATKAA